MKFFFGIILCVCVLLPVSLVHSSEFYWLKTYPKEWFYAGKQSFLEGNVSLQLLDSLDNYFSEPYYYIFFGNPEKIEGYLSCALNLFRIEGNQSFNQYQGINFGYNCGTYSFTRDSENYMLGGYGFWNHHLDLIKFDVKSGGWELVSVKNQPLDLGPFGLYQTSKGFYNLFVASFNPRIPDHKQKIEPGFFLDWETKTWKKLQIRIEGVDFLELLPSLSLNSLETKDYLFVGTSFITKNLGWNLVHKESGKIYFFQHNRSLDPFQSNHVEIVNNKITYLSPTNSMVNLDLDDFFSKSVEVGEVIVVEDKVFFSYINWVLPPLLLGFIGFSVFFFISRRKKDEEFNPISEEETVEDKDLIQVLVSYSGQTLSTERLDQVFGIHGLKNFDTRRIKRARQIKVINESYMASHGKELIVRDRNPEDRRYMFYKILL